jgi:hypothetical protein
MLIGTIAKVRARPEELFGADGWGKNLGNKSRPTLEGYVAPQPVYRDNKTIPDAN